MQKKNVNVFIFPIVALFTFFMLIFGATYAYLSGIVNMNTSNYQVTLPKVTSLVCTKTDCNVNVTPAMMTSGNTNTTTPKTTSSCYVECTCSGTPGAVCNYNVTLVEAGEYYWPSSGLGTNTELSVTVASPSGCNAQNGSSTEVQVNTVKDKLVSNCSLTVPSGGSVSANISAEFKWYNLDINQDRHLSKVYKYQLSTEHELPNEYQLVEYISVSGTQYINTRLSTATTKKHEYVLDIEAISSPGWTGVNGSMQLKINGTLPRRVYQVKYDGSTGLEQVYIDGNYNNQTKFGVGSYLGEIWVGKLSNYNGSGIAGNIYRFKVYENGVLERDMVPCYRKEGTIIGLYDLVHGVFYENEGSGSFTKGNDI